MSDGPFASSVAQLRQTLECSGWSVVPLPADADLRALIPVLRPHLAGRADRIGIERVSPKRRDQARAGTLSARYGLGPFPLHTERAHWRRPPRFVVFRSVGNPTDRPTTLADSHQLSGRNDLITWLHDVPWKVEWNEASFETRVLMPDAESRWQVRYDPCCMTVCRPEHRELQAELDEELQRFSLEEHHWTRDTALVIDNWRVLHGRGSSARIDHDRVLERLVIP